MSPGLFGDFMDGYIKYYDLPKAAEDGLQVWKTSTEFTWLTDS